MNIPAKELSLRPYHGRLFYAKNRKDFEKCHEVLFKETYKLTSDHMGRFAGLEIGEGHDSMWTYLVWGSSPPYIAHELSRAILHVFGRVGIDPRGNAEEAFCYMLSQLMLEAK